MRASARVRGALVVTGFVMGRYEGGLVGMGSRLARVRGARVPLGHAMHLGGSLPARVLARCTRMILLLALLDPARCLRVFMPLADFVRSARMCRFHFTVLGPRGLRVFSPFEDGRRSSRHGSRVGRDPLDTHVRCTRVGQRGAQREILGSTAGNFEFAGAVAHANGPHVPPGDTAPPADERQ